MSSRRGVPSRPQRSGRRPKRLPRQLTLAQRGIHLIEGVVLQMHPRWNPTANTDIGIDGTIELCDAATGEALGLILQVQSKATEASWPGETSESFRYVCRADDLDYWLRGNAPVLVIVSRPTTGEAY